MPVAATLTIFLKLTAKQDFIPMCCLSRKEDGWRWFQFTGPCPSFWVNFSELQVARGWYIWSFTAGTCVCVCICETTRCKKMWGRRWCLHNCWSASRVTVKGWDQSSKLLLSSPSTSSHYTASSKHRGVCLKLCLYVIRKLVKKWRGLLLYVESRFSQVVHSCTSPLLLNSLPL